MQGGFRVEEVVMWRKGWKVTDDGRPDLILRPAASFALPRRPGRKCQNCCSSPGRHEKQRCLLHENMCVYLAIQPIHCTPSAPQPTPALSIASSAPSTASTSLPSPSLSAHDDVNSPDFVSRAPHFPLVGTALRAYEHGKASSRVVKVCFHMTVHHYYSH